jgi:outer membrane murein-binding lipoprotein Lpp
MRKITIFAAMFAIILSSAAASGNESGTDAFNRFNDAVHENNAEIKRLKNDLAAGERELRAASKTSPIGLEIEGERTLESGEEKKYETKNIEFSKSFSASDGSGLIKRKNSVEAKIRAGQTQKAIDDITYEAYAGVLAGVKASCQKKLAGENLKIAENIIDAVTQKYEVALGSKMEIEQAALDYEVQVLKAIEASAIFENQKAALEIKNGLRASAVSDSLFDARSRASLTAEVETLLRSAETAVDGIAALYSGALETRRDLKAALYEVELIKASIEAEKRSNSPEFKIGVYRSVNDLAEAERGVKFGISLPVYDFGRRNDAAAALKMKLAGYQTLRDAKSFYIEHIERLILLDITEKYNLCAAGREKLKRLSGVGLTRASKLFTMATIGYTEGATTLFEYQNAKKSYFEFFEQLITAAVDFNISLLELRRACGLPPDKNADIIGRFIELK